MSVPAIGFLASMLCARAMAYRHGHVLDVRYDCAASRLTVGQICAETCAVVAGTTAMAMILDEAVSNRQGFAGGRGPPRHRDPARGTGAAAHLAPIPRRPRRHQHLDFGEGALRPARLYAGDLDPAGSGNWRAARPQPAPAPGRQPRPPRPAPSGWPRAISAIIRGPRWRRWKAPMSRCARPSAAGARSSPIAP